MHSMNWREESLALHKKMRGKIEIKSRVPVKTKKDLSLAYTPGVAEPCLAIQKDPSLSFELTRRWNLCLVLTDGSAVLGLGDLGPEAAMPVLESKCVLFKELGGVDAFPLCVRTRDVDEIVRLVELLSGSFGGVSLEEIAAPRCFEIEKKLRERLPIPVFHNDQHGVAVMVLAGLMGALKVVNKRSDSVRVVINGAGAAGLATCRLLLLGGFDQILLCDKDGILMEGDEAGLTEEQKRMVRLTNRDKEKGTLVDALRGADVFVGTSRPGLLTADMVESMAADPIVFATAQPTPEIWPEEAEAAGARVIATSLPGSKNRLSNALVFPGVFRGAFDVRASDITPSMKLAAAHALADLVTEKDIQQGVILPSIVDPRVAEAVAVAVSVEARIAGVAGL